MEWIFWVFFCVLFFLGVDLFEGIIFYIIIYVNFRFVWFVFIVDEVKYFYIYRNKRLLFLLKFFFFNFISKFVVGMLRNGNECSCLRFFFIKKERNIVYREIFFLFIYFFIFCCYWVNLRLGDFKISIK